MCLSILLLMDIIGLFQAFTVINNVSVNILVHVLWIYVPISIGCVTRRDFKCTDVYFHQQQMRVLVIYILIKLGIVTCILAIFMGVC